MLQDQCKMLKMDGFFDKMEWVFSHSGFLLLISQHKTQQLMTIYALKLLKQD